MATVYVYQNTAPRQMVITVPTGESWDWHEIQETRTRWDHPYLTLIRTYEDGSGDNDHSGGGDTVDLSSILVWAGGRLSSRVASYWQTKPTVYN